MKKLTLLTMSLLCTALAQSSIVLETTITKNSEEFVMEPVVLTEENSTAEYVLADEICKIVLTKSTVVDEQLVNSFDVFMIKDGVEQLVMQPELQSLPGTITLSQTVDENVESITITVHQAE